MGLTYASLYMGRFNLDLSNKSFSEHYGLGKGQIGAILSAASLVYGVSSFLNGPVVDRLGGRRALLMGVFGAAFFNFAFGIGGYFGFLASPALVLGYFGTVWCCNMYCQSYSSLALVKINTSWFHVSERGRFSGVFGMVIQSGRLLILPLGGLLMSIGPWTLMFLLPATIVTIFGFITSLIVRGSPEQAGLESLETGDAIHRASKSGGHLKLSDTLSVDSPVLMLAAGALCVGVVRMGFDSWYPRFVQEHLHVSLGSVFFQSSAWGVGLAGIGGALAAGYLSDMLFDSRRPPVALLGFSLQLVSLLTLSLAHSVQLISAAFVVNVFGVSMSHSMLASAAAMDFGGRERVASVAGVIDGVGYLGGVLSGVPLGLLIEAQGWRVWGPCMALFSVVGLALMARLWKTRPGGWPQTGAPFP